MIPLSMAADGEPPLDTIFTRPAGQLNPEADFFGLPVIRGPYGNVRGRMPLFPAASTAHENRDPGHPLGRGIFDPMEISTSRHSNPHNSQDASMEASPLGATGDDQPIPSTCEEQDLRSPGNFPCRFIFSLHDFKSGTRYAELHLEVASFHKTVTGVDKFILNRDIILPAQVAPMIDFSGLNPNLLDGRDKVAQKHGFVHRRLWFLRRGSGWQGQLRVYGQGTRDLAMFNVNRGDFGAWLESLQAREVTGWVQVAGSKTVPGQIYQWLCAQEEWDRMSLVGGLYKKRPVNGAWCFVDVPQTEVDDITTHIWWK